MCNELLGAFRNVAYEWKSSCAVFVHCNDFFFE